MENKQEMIYQSVVNCVSDSNLQMLQYKINRLKSIADYKDASVLLDECYRKVGKVKRRMVMKKVGRVVLTVLDYSIIVFAVILCMFLLLKDKILML